MVDGARAVQAVQGDARAYLRRVDEARPSFVTIAQILDGVVGLRLVGSVEVIVFGAIVEAEEHRRGHGWVAEDETHLVFSAIAEIGSYEFQLGVVGRVDVVSDQATVRTIERNCVVNVAVRLCVGMQSDSMSNSNEDMGTYSCFNLCCSHRGGNHGHRDGGKEDAVAGELERHCGGWAAFTSRGTMLWQRNCALFMPTVQPFSSDSRS